MRTLSTLPSSTSRFHLKLDLQISLEPKIPSSSCRHLKELDAVLSQRPKVDEVVIEFRLFASWYTDYYSRSSDEDPDVVLPPRDAAELVKAQLSLLASSNVLKLTAYLLNTYDDSSDSS